ncbi:hypothetical protein ACX12E_18515 [Paenibacillus vandeheii]
MGIPDDLKNTLDCASRPGKSTLLIQKPFAIAGATTGSEGTAKSQAQVRQNACHEKFAKNGFGL